MAVFDDQAGLLAHEVYSQIDLHRVYGGVVPELASRDHVRRLLPLVRTALADAKTAPGQLDGVAYTAGPGLIGALLTGAALGRSLAFAWTKTAGPAVVLTGPTTATPTFVASSVGTYVFELAVSNGGAQSAPDAVSVQVQYAFGGFIAPKPNATFKGGKKIDGRFRLLNSAGSLVAGATGTFVMVRTDGPATPVTGS